MKKRITFLMPGLGHTPTGGYKVVYEYANRLIKDYNVTIVYVDPLSWILKGHKVRRRISYWKLRFKNNYRCSSWFPLKIGRGGVKEVLCLNLKEKHVPRSDIYFATAVQTAYYLKKYKRVDDRNKYYLIQGFENWGMTTQQVMDSYSFGFNNITISKWLTEIALKAGNRNTTMIENGFDFNAFGIRKPIPERNRFHFLLLYHHVESKGTNDGLAALEIVYQKIVSVYGVDCDFKVSMFGALRPDTALLPEYVDFYHRPSGDKLTDIYNEASIFLGTSHGEGWGLTLGESMICGCAVVCTDANGYDEMAIDGQTALVSPVADPEAMADNIMKLLDDDDLRVRIAKNGNEYIQRFTWERSIEKMMALLEKNS